VVCWRRTGLPFATAAGIAGAVTALALTVLAMMGHPYPDLRAETWVLFGSGALLAPLFLLIESRVNQEKWRAWSRYMSEATVWDVLLSRHIPLLRDRHGPDRVTARRA